MVVAFVSLNVYAGKDKNKMIVQSGSLEFLHLHANAILEMDYSSTLWEGDEFYKTWSGNDYEKRVEISRKSFTQEFNEVSDGLKINSIDAKYKIIFRVDELEQHKGSGSWGQFYMAISGVIDIIDIESGTSVLKINLNRVSGPPNYAMSERIEEAFASVAKRLYKMQ